MTTSQPRTVLRTPRASASMIAARYRAIGDCPVQLQPDFRRVVTREMKIDVIRSLRQADIEKEIRSTIIVRFGLLRGPPERERESYARGVRGRGTTHSALPRAAISRFSSVAGHLLRSGRSPAAILIHGCPLRNSAVHTGVSQITFSCSVCAEPLLRSSLFREIQLLCRSAFPRPPRCREFDASRISILCRDPREERQPCLFSLAIFSNFVIKKDLPLRFLAYVAL